MGAGVVGLVDAGVVVFVAAGVVGLVVAGVAGLLLLCGLSDDGTYCAVIGVPVFSWPLTWDFNLESLVNLLPHAGNGHT